MSIKVWPFLISRNRHLDYRTVVAPDFICEAKIPNLLARVTEGELTGSGRGCIRNIVGSKVDDFTIVFRVIKATEKDINLTGGDTALKDQFGREIYLFEGVVAKVIRESFAISGSDFQEVHQRLTSEYKEFWNLVDPAPAAPSQPFNLNVENVISPVVLEKLTPFDLTPKPSEPVSVDIKKTESLKSKKVSATLFLLLIFLLIIGLIFGRVLFGSTVSLGCSSTAEKEIELKTGNNDISNQLMKLKSEYPERTSIYLSGSLKIESSRNIRNEEYPSNSQMRPTIILSEDNRLEMTFHPIDLAIGDVRNQELNENSRITLRLIDRSECT